ncbi:MAG TPA: hypothetical protein VLJ38_21335, partial [Polyangiaceae bacterium]|nr:hypothetical protein [Polyangiaceae bacterium]
MQTKLVHWVAGCLMVLGAGCGAAEQSGSEQVGVVGEALAGSNAHGVLPAGLPARLGVGLFEGPGGTWMKTSGA